MPLPDISAEDSGHLPAPPNAMTIVALGRRALHEKIARLRALRVETEAEKAQNATKVLVSVA